MSSSSDHASEPLLPNSSSSSGKSYGSTTQNDSNSVDEAQHPDLDRAVEDDVFPETATQGRNIGWSSAYILIMSRVIGSGIFATPGAVFTAAGSVGLTLTLWIIGAVIAWSGLVVALEYACMLPRSGGFKVWLEFTYRHPRFLASTVVAVYAVLLGFTASNCIVFAQYVLFALRQDLTAFTQKGLAVVLLSGITIMHGCFLKTGIFVQNALGWIKIALLLFMVFSSVFAVFLRSNAMLDLDSATSDTGISWSHLWKGSQWNWGILATAIFQVFYSYAGLENVTNVLNEVKNPVRTLRTASTAALTSACVLYVLINIAYFSVVPSDEIKRGGELVAALFFERLLGPTTGRVVLPLAIAISAAGNVMVVTFSLSRLNQEIARQGILPFSRLMASSKPFNAPLGGLLVHYIPSLLVIIIPTGDVYSFILEVEAYPVQFFSLATSAGLIWLRFKRHDLHRPYKAFLPAVGFRGLLAIALLAAPFVPREALDGRTHLYQVSYALVGSSVLLIGFVYWLIWFVLIPKWKGYQLEEQVALLDDGTSITRIVPTPKI